MTRPGQQRAARGRRIPFAERGPDQSYRPDSRPLTVYGAHQPGIVTPQLERIAFGALDLTGDLRGLLAAWTRAAERLMAAGRVTVTIGLGPSLFDRCGLGGERPAGLRELPAFRGDALEPGISGGDLCVLACAAEPEPARAALERLVATAGAAARVRWTQAGFLAGSPADGTPRDLLGFKSGTSNVRRARDRERHVWVRAGERRWMAGGTFLVVRRIRLALAQWNRLPVAEQERVIGRHKASGAPLGRRREYDALPLDGGAIAPDAHVRLAARETNAGAAMLRRSYSYDNGGDDAGLLFLAYVRDPRRQYVPLQRRLAEHDALAPFGRHVGSAVFAIPPGARPRDILAGDLLTAARPPAAGAGSAGSPAARAR